MEEEQAEITPVGPYIGEELFSWTVDGYERHERGPVWYAIAFLIGLSLVLYAIVTRNFLFAIVVVMAGVIIALIGLILAFFMLVLVPAPFLGRFYYRVMEGQRTFLTPVFAPVERFCYRIAGVDAEREQDWKGYCVALLAFIPEGG